MKRTAVILSVILAFSATGIAQVRTVTNSELTRYKQERLAAQRELRENYAQLGFPSPEELDIQLEEDRAERLELSAKLRAERLELARIDIDRARLDIDRSRAEAEIAAAYSAGRSESAESQQPYYGIEPYGYGSWGGFGGYIGTPRYGVGGFGRYYPRRRFGRPYAFPGGIYGSPRFSNRRSRAIVKRW